MTAAGMAALEAFLRGALARPLPGAAAQRRFAPIPPLSGWSPDLRPRTARHAATLLLLHPGTRGPAIPLTVRRPDRPDHAGQVSLPGGAVDPGETPETAALREADEEIGVRADAVRLIGPLSTVWIAVSNFVVHPFLAVTDTAPSFVPHPDEVESLLELPVDEVRNRARLKWTTRPRGTSEMRVPYFEVGPHVVWGATAMILGEFACLFDREHGPAPPA
jgi:8-oxo-dGTP pyrophosphatase MutT (NUDIX family)